MLADNVDCLQFFIDIWHCNGNLLVKCSVVFTEAQYVSVFFFFKLEPKFYEVNVKGREGRGD